MQAITLQETEMVGGAGIWSFVANKLIWASIEYVGGLAASGQIDYAGVAEAQGSYYNTVGA